MASIGVLKNLSGILYPVTIGEAVLVNGEILNNILDEINKKYLDLEYKVVSSQMRINELEDKLSKLSVSSGVIVTPPVIEPTSGEIKLTDDNLSLYEDKNISYDDEQSILRLISNDVNIIYDKNLNSLTIIDRD